MLMLCCWFLKGSAVTPQGTFHGGEPSQMLQGKLSFSDTFLNLSAFKNFRVFVMFLYVILSQCCLGLTFKYLMISKS